MTLRAGWFVRLEDLALGALEAFDAVLMAQGGAPRPAGYPLTVLRPARQSASARSKRSTPGSGPRLRVRALTAGQGARRTDGSQQVAPCPARCRGLPPPMAFAALLDGRWAQRGWA
jgi:hypothetical protein